MSATPAKGDDFFGRVKAILAVMIPLMLALLAYLKATGANDSAANDEKIRQLMFSTLPTKSEVQAHWTAQDAQYAETMRRLEKSEDRERQDAVDAAYIRGRLDEIEKLKK
jgi:hypothetical protein